MTEGVDVGGQALLQRYLASPGQALERLIRLEGSDALPSSRLAIVMMVRDELDILPYFLHHHLRLVDEIFIVDHLSMDGTREFLADLASDPALSDRLHLFTHDEVAFLQSRVTTELARLAFSRGADWVFPIDADEFLQVEDRADIEGRLASSRSRLAKFEWLNIIPRLHGPQPAKPDRFDIAGPFENLAGGVELRMGKVAVHRSVLDLSGALALGPGGHVVELAPGAAVLDGPKVGHLLHLPARSLPQIASKGRNQSVSQLLENAQTADPGRLEEKEKWRAGYERQFRSAVEAQESEDALVQAQEIFEQVAIRYEKSERKTRPRAEWRRHDVALPVSLTETASERLLALKQRAEALNRPVDISAGDQIQAEDSRYSSSSPAGLSVRLYEGRVVIGRSRLRPAQQRAARLWLLARAWGVVGLSVRSLLLGLSAVARGAARRGEVRGRPREGHFL